MEFDIRAIFERMKIAAHCENDFQLSKFMNRSSGTISGWKNGSQPPWNGLWEIRLRTGVTMDWLLTGEEKEQIQLEEKSKLASDYKTFQHSVKETLSLGFTLGYIAKTSKTIEAEEVLSRVCYAKYKNINLENADNILDTALNSSNKKQNSN